MESKVGTKCNIEEHINTFHREDSECNDFKSKRGLKRYFGKQDKITNQRKMYYEKIHMNYCKSKILDKKFLKNYIVSILNYKVD